ncbi:MAG: hypothetical protein LBD71_04235 [Treponema sp.]|jgi:hypothetical protein|nr:hypothetical protein [Treponema sp.]
MKKVYACVSLILQALFFSTCNLFHTSLAEYLYENPPVSQSGIPPQLRMGDLFVAYNGGRYEPIEPLSESRSRYTICVIPASKTDTGNATLYAVPLESSSTPAVDTPSWTIPPRGLPALYWE